MRNSGLLATAMLLAACGGHSLRSGNDANGNQFTLTINVVGKGTVTAAAQSITCTSICAQQIAAGAGMHLDASPAEGMRFLGWSGACSGMDGCDLELSQDTQVGANFASGASVSVVLVGAGSGRVISSPAGIDCPGTCTMAVAPGGIRAGASGHDICFIHPRPNDAFPVAGAGVLIELVQAPAEVVAAWHAARDGENAVEL